MDGKKWSSNLFNYKWQKRLNEHDFLRTDCQQNALAPQNVVQEQNTHHNTTCQCSLPCWMSFMGQPLFQKTPRMGYWCLDSNSMEWWVSPDCADQYVLGTIDLECQVRSIVSYGVSEMKEITFLAIFGACDTCTKLLPCFKLQKVRL